jgi:hypothetical protein
METVAIRIVPIVKSPLDSFRGRRVQSSAYLSYLAPVYSPPKRQASVSISK